jgi:hypothetical protein
MEPLTSFFQEFSRGLQIDFSAGQRGMPQIRGQQRQLGGQRCPLTIPGHETLHGKRVAKVMEPRSPCAHGTTQPTRAENVQKQATDPRLAVRPPVGIDEHRRRRHRGESGSLPLVEEHRDGVSRGGCDGDVAGFIELRLANQQYPVREVHISQRQFQRFANAQTGGRKYSNERGEKHRTQGARWTNLSGPRHEGPHLRVREDEGRVGDWPHVEKFIAKKDATLLFRLRKPKGWAEVMKSRKQKKEKREN